MEAGSGYILEVQFNPTEDFTVEFYVERERSVKFSRDELVRVTTEEGEKLYAMIDSSRVGRGNLMCRAEVFDREAHWGMRPVVLKGFTGYSVGNCLCGVGGGFGCDGSSLDTLLVGPYLISSSQATLLYLKDSLHLLLSPIPF